MTIIQNPKYEDRTNDEDIVQNHLTKMKRLRPCEYQSTGRSSGMMSDDE